MEPSTAGVAEIPCGFRAKRLFILGCTVFRGKPLDVHGSIEIVYRSGPPDRVSLIVGYTLEGDFKLLSRSKAMHLHPSGDPFQYYMVLAPRPETIQMVQLRRASESANLPWITAITCETDETADCLGPLPDCRPGEQEAAWIRSHAISGDSPKTESIFAEIRRAHKIGK